MTWDDVVEIPPWGNDSDWKQANTSIRYLIERHRTVLGPAMNTARQIEMQMNSFFPLQDRLVQETCVHCQCPCCETATVWFDFCDLLFIHMTDRALPHGQLIGKQGDICGCFSHRGCVIPRLSRPWVCNLYFCPPQMHRIRCRGEETREHVTRIIQTIRESRKILEDQFIDMTS